jgi:hypothetical protein
LGFYEVKNASYKFRFFVGKKRGLEVPFFNKKFPKSPKLLKNQYAKSIGKKSLRKIKSSKKTMQKSTRNHHAKKPKTLQNNLL